MIKIDRIYLKNVFRKYFGNRVKFWVMKITKKKNYHINDIYTSLMI